MTSRPGYLKHIKRDAVFENEIILCKCGCETQIERYWKDKRGYWWERFYIRGHIRRGMKNSEKQKEVAKNIAATSPGWHEKVMKGVERRNSNPNWVDSVSSETAKERWQTTRKHELVEKVRVSCFYCGTEAMVNPLRKKYKLYFCNHECSGLYHSRENHPLYIGKPKQYPRTWKKSLKMKIIARDGGKCVICEQPPKNNKNLPVHHIDENKENCDENNLVTLCPSCHKSVHFGTKHLPLRYIEMRYGSEA